MPKPVTLFTGQWADLPFETICEKAAQFGYDGLELCCWGDHFDVEQAAESDDYCKGRWETLRKHGLSCYALSNHLTGQAVCDRVDERHQAIVPEKVWGDGDPEGVRQRAQERMIVTGKAARRLMDNKPEDGTDWGRKPAVVNGFTGSPIWHLIYPFPPTPQDMIQAGYEEFARRWKPILDEYDKLDVNFALEAHPGEIAFDIATAERAIAALDGHPRFGFNYDPSNLAYHQVDYIRFIRDFRERIYHMHMKDVWWSRGDGSVSVFGGHTEFADPRRWWDFRSIGRGDIDFESIIVTLNDIGYRGPLSVEWEDNRMDREQGATEAAAYCRQIDIEPSQIAFDAQYDR